MVWDKAKRGLADPQRAAKILYDMHVSDTVGRAQLARIEAHRQWRAVPKQRPLIHEFVDSEEFVLVVLDACRFDAFERAIGDYLTGDLTKVWASGRWTAQYIHRTWNDGHDLTYLSPIPVVSDWYFDNHRYDSQPSQQFDELVPLWETDWDPVRGAVPAEAVTDAALACLDRDGPTRLVAHYAQPHAPYLGSDELLGWEGDIGDNEDIDGAEELYRSEALQPTDRIYERVRRGEVSDSELVRAYYANLEYALDEVVRLVRHADCPIVITGDHGEHLSENGRYFHDEDSAFIRQVPWFVVDPSEAGHESVSGEYELKSGGSDVSDDEKRSRLRDLGYLDG